MRIHVTGDAGSGKTTLGKKIGAELNLPVFGLDQVVWQPGWTKTPA
ncbi:MAG: adenylate kinase family enzyme, partial [Granulosicoccus sp.]